MVVLDASRWALLASLLAGLAAAFFLVGWDVSRQGRFSPAYRSGLVRERAVRAASVRAALDAIAPLITVIFPADVRAATERKLVWAGLEDLSAADFLGFKLLAAGFLPLLGMLAGVLLGADPAWFLLLAGAGYVLPDAWLNRRVKERQERIARDLSTLGSFAATALTAGLGVKESFQHAAEWLGGPLGAEVSRAVAKAATGSWADALLEAADRTGVAEFQQMAQMVAQVERYGTRVEDALAQFSWQVRTMRRYAAEKLAGELSVKLIFPIFFFIGIPTMVLMGYPMLMHIRKMLAGG